MPVKSSYCNHHFAQHTKRWQWHTFISNTNFALIQSRVKYFRLADAIKFFLFVFRTNIASIFVVTINKDFRAFARMYEMLMLVLREKHGHLSEKALKFFEKSDKSSFNYYFISEYNANCCHLRVRVPTMFRTSAFSDYFYTCVCFV